MSVVAGAAERVGRRLEADRLEPKAERYIIIGRHAERESVAPSGRGPDDARRHPDRGPLGWLRLAGFFRPFEYDEDIHLSLDGSATIYVNASLPALGGAA